MKRNVNDWERVASVVAASFVLWAAWKRPRGNRAGALVTAAGLLSRGLSGYCLVNAALGRERRRDDTKRALGGDNGIFLRERITVQSPADRLYRFWLQPANLPQVMPYVESVDPLDARRSHWVVTGPAGVHLEWDAEIINRVPYETIAWQSLPGADVASAGSVRFRELAPGLTDVIVTMQYDPPAGKLGASVASAMGASVSKRVRQALVEFKRSMEASGPVARGELVSQPF